MKTKVKTSFTQNIFRVLLALLMMYAGFSHLTFNRINFQAQVPDWLPLKKDLVVIVSGWVEIAIELVLLLWKKYYAPASLFLAIFFILVFPRNISQYLQARDAFGILDSDRARLIRLLFQPVLIIWALWSLGALKAIKKL